MGRWGDGENVLVYSLYDEIRAANTRPEIELLLCCARTYIDLETAGRIRNLLQEDIDWDCLIRTALSHGVMPLLYWTLNATCPEAVPKAILTQLRNYFHANAQHNLFLTGELLKLLNLLAAHEIPAIPFKGPVLTASAYGYLSLRQFCDLDILVHERDVLRTKNLLISQGFRPYFPTASVQEVAYLQSLTGAEEAVYFKRHWEYHLSRDNGGVNVDLHWGVLPRYFSFWLDLEWLWERVEPVCVADTTVLSFPPEDLLLILCMHGAKDCWKQLARLCDVAELIRTQQGINWRRIIEQANTLGSERILFLGLSLASELLGTALPEEVLQRMQADPVVKSLAVQVREQLFCEVDLQSGNSKIKSTLFHLRVRERLQDKVRCCLHWMTPTVADWVLLPLPPSLSFLYYLLRPIRLVGKYGLRQLKNPL